MVNLRSMKYSSAHSTSELIEIALKGEVIDSYSLAESTLSLHVGCITYSVRVDDAPGFLRSLIRSASPVRPH